MNKQIAYLEGYLNHLKVTVDRQETSSAKVFYTGMIKGVEESLIIMKKVI